MDHTINFFPNLKLISCKQKADYTDQTVEYLKNKCSFLEETLNNLASNLSNLIIGFDKLSLKVSNNFSKFNYFVSKPSTVLIKKNKKKFNFIK